MRQLNCLSHLQRMDKHRTAKVMWETRMPATRKRGRPQRSRDDVPHNILAKKRRTNIEAKAMARHFEYYVI